MATDNIALARRLVDEVWNQGNYGRVKDLVSTDHVLRDPLSREARGLDAFTQYVRMQRTAFPDLSFTVDEVFGAGDRILVRWTARGTHKGPLMGIPATGKVGIVSGVAVHRVQGGKMVETLNFWNVLELAQNLGIAPPLEQMARTKPTAAAPH